MAAAVRHRRSSIAEDVPGQARRRCPHDIADPRWCKVCQVHWQSRMRHPSWPRREPATPTRD